MNSDGAQDKFLSKLVQSMEKYPWCDSVDINLEKADDYSTVAKSTIMFRNIYNTVRAYDPTKLMNICLPGMDSINGFLTGKIKCGQYLRSDVLQLTFLGYWSLTTNLM